MANLFRRLSYWMRQRQLDADLREELQFHQQMKARELKDDGLSEADAALAARRAIGNTTLAREDARAVWIWPWLESVWQDAAYALRNLVAHPGFTLVALATLAAAIGLNTSVFSVFNAIAFRPWPVSDPGRVVTVYSRPARGGFRTAGFALVEYRYLNEHAKSFEGLVGWRAVPVHLGFEAFGATSGAMAVSGNYFRVLGVEMARGRGFLPEEDRLEAPQPLVVLSDALWRARFGADPDIVGRQIRLNEVPFTVVGVASKAFTGTEMDRQDLWIPLASMLLLRPKDASVVAVLRSASYCCSKVAGRLAPGVDREQARSELDVLSRQFRAQSALDAGGIVLADTTFLSQPSIGPAAAPLFGLMFAAVLLVLILACANVGNLLLARGAARSREIAVRLSLGASRLRVVRQLLTESLLLAVGAGAIGIVMAYELPVFLLHQMPEPVQLDIRPDAVVLGYALALAVASCLAFGLAPALHATSQPISGTLKHEPAPGAARLSLRNALLGVQVAVSVILLTGAGLLVRAVQHARTVDPGFAIDDVAVVSFEFPAQAYDDARSGELIRQVAQELEHAPDRQPFGLASVEPLSDVHMYAMMRMHGESVDRQTIVAVVDASAGYFDVLHVPVVAGRGFQPGDAEHHVVLVNETMARRYWPGRSPLGQSIVAGSQAREIVGIVKDAYVGGLDEIEPTFFEPPFEHGVPKLLLRARAGGSHGKVAAIVSRLDPRVHVETVPLSATRDRYLAPSRVGASVAGFLGGFALLLAMVGMFGVFAYVVQQRTREIGVRMALGARRWDVIRLVLGGNTRAVVAGLAVGFIGSAAASILLQRFLYGVSPFDLRTYASIAAIVAAAALAASYAPVRRAVKVDPMVALRYE